MILFYEHCPIGLYFIIFEVRYFYQNRLDYGSLYDLFNHIPHGIRCFPHHLRRGVGVGAQGEACAVVPQGAGQGFHVYAVLQRQRCKCVSEVMEPNMLRPDGLIFYNDTYLERAL